MSALATSTALIAAAVIPSLVLLLLLNTAELRLVGGIRWRAGRPWGPLALAFVAGVAGAWPAYGLERCLVKAPWALDNMGAVILFWVIVAGAVEEGCKFAAYHLGPSTSSFNQDEYDGILFAAAVALGFACIENVLYVREAGFETARLRAVTAVPAHAMFGVLMGVGLGVAKSRARVGWSPMGVSLTALALAVAAHGVYDVLASLPVRVATIGITIFLTALLAITTRLCWRARRHSPAFGGQRFTLPPPCGTLRLPPMPAPRNPWMAGLLGLIPGLGQAYNGELPKSALFLSVGLMNIGLYWVAHMFVTDPMGAIALLKTFGITITVKPEELTLAVEQKRLLEPTLLGLVLMWEMVGAAEAWSTARRRWRLPQIHAVRRSFAPHGFGASYVAHVLVVFLLVIAPVVEFAAGGTPSPAASEPGKTHGETAETSAGMSTAGQEAANAGRQREWTLTWVKAPVHIEGWQERPEGRESGASRAQDDFIPRPPTAMGGDLSSFPRHARYPRPRAGQSGSYDQYLSYQIRRRGTDMHFFRHVRRSTWAVVHYRIRHDGRLLLAELVKYGGGPLDQAKRAVDVIRWSAPYEPLPEDARELDVIELFWSVRYRQFTPGSLEESLSQLPDGRRVRATK